MAATVQTVQQVEPHGDNLSIVTTNAGHRVIANRQEDGSFRWAAGEVVVYVSEGSILPEEVLKERGYWDHEKNRGLLDGGGRNRVKMKRLAGFESRGLLFKTGTIEGDENLYLFNNGAAHIIELGQDVSAELGVTEFTG